MTTQQLTEVLLVEDNPDEAGLTLRSLKKLNISNHVLHLQDGAEAISFLFATSNKPALKLILLDLKMPKVDGLELLKRIKSDENLRVVPVVILTSSKEERDIEDCYRLGVNSYVVKPMSFQVFSSVVSDIGNFWLMINQPPRTP